MSTFHAIRRASARVALATLCVLAFSSAARAQDKNLLANPGFEDVREGQAWMPASWDTTRGNTEMVFFGRDEFSSHSGKAGISVANASATQPLWHNWNQTVDVTPDMWNKDLVFTIWTRSNGVDGRGFVCVKAYRDTVGKMARQWKIPRDEAGRKMMMAGVGDPVTDLAWKRESFDDHDTPWTQRKVRVYLPPTSDLIVVSLGIFGTGQVMFDDASLTLDTAEPATVPLHTNLIADPGFEGNTLPWELSTPPFPPLIAAKDTTRAHTGRASMHFACEAGLISGSSGVAQVFCNRALAGKRLRLSAWVRCDTLKSSVFVHLYSHTKNGFKQVSSPQAAYGTMDWTKLQVEADIPDDTYSVWAWIQYAAPIAGHVWFDDVALEALGPATGKPVTGLESEPRPAKSSKKSGSR